MKKTDHEIQARPAHDRKGVVILTPNDVVDISIDEAEKLSAKILRAAKAAHERTPPAPEPIDFSDEYPNDKHAKEFASCCVDVDDSGGIGIAGYDLDIGSAKKLRDWLDAAIKYGEQSTT